MKGTIAARVGLAIASLLMAGSAWAQMPSDPPGQEMGGGTGARMDMHRPPMERAFVRHGIEGRWWNNPRIIERLKLTDAQRKEFDSILLQHKEKLIDLRANVEKAELEMQPLVGADQPDETKILGQIDKVAQARAELEKANARYLLDLRSKLTPEQWKEVQEFRQNRGMEREDHGWGKGGQMHGRMRDGNGPGAAPSGQQGPPPPPPAGPGSGDNQ